MPINITTILTKEQFDLRLANLLGQLEGRRPLPYIDTAKEKIPTIGIGINLRVPANLTSVFNAMGVPASKRAALTAIINDTSITTDTALQQQLDAELGKPFVMTDPQIVSTYTELVKSYVTSAKAKNGLPYSDELIALVVACSSPVAKQLTIAALDPVGKIPEFMYCAVAIRRGGTPAKTQGFGAAEAMLG